MALFTIIDHDIPQSFSPEDDVIIQEKIFGTESLVAATRQQDGCITLSAYSCNRKVDVNSTTAEDQAPLFPLPIVREILIHLILARNAQSATIYGSVFGKYHHFHYGRKNFFDYRASDILVNNQFLDLATTESWMTTYDIIPAPVLYKGPYNPRKVKQLALSNTALISPPHNIPCEGVVVKPLLKCPTTSPPLHVIIVKNPRFTTRT